jgi:hypothetical protein
MTTQADAITRECAGIEEAGGAVHLRSPRDVPVDDLMSPTVIPRALQEGADAARADLPALHALWD